MTYIEKVIGGVGMDFHPNAVFVHCKCYGDFGGGKWVRRHFWERGPEKMVQRAIAHALRHTLKSQQAVAAATYAADYAEAIAEEAR